MSVVMVAAVASLAGCFLTVLVTLVRERYRRSRVIAAVQQLRDGSVYVDNARGVRIQIGSAKPPAPPTSDPG